MTIDTAKERERLRKLGEHTPGPWGDDSLEHEDPYTPLTIKAGRQSICKVWIDDAPDHYFNEQQRINARLIAAAPDLKRDYLTALDVIDAQAAEIERLREALAIFTRHYEPWMDEHSDADVSASYSRHTFGDLRRARAALRQDEGEG